MSIILFITKMNVRTLDLNLLVVFEAVYTEGNLTRAADRLNMSQPAVSNALARLRAALDDPLFARTARGMTPTPRARQMIQEVRQALDLITSAVCTNSAMFNFAQSGRVFSIAAEDYGEAVITPRLMDWLTGVAPSLKANIVNKQNANLLQEMRDGSIDLLIDYFKVRAEGFTNQCIIVDELVSMVRVEHPTIHDVLTLEQFIAMPHVVLAQKSPIVDRELAKRGLERNCALQVPHFISMPLIVKSTDFICTLPRRMAMLYMEYFPVKVLRAPIEFPKIPIYAIWNDNMERDPGHQWLRESLAEMCQRL
ncbi:LysR family transcriptional regulator [Indioceanicola profundi]|uniref:LysR family transcriptional regulator n=1 Tax=Indioceanicola profundi TaxID=2220096 RepID=UPI001CECD9EC|nr:LysR family transcriptional regulator [Indioceanicola profundi]